MNFIASYAKRAVSCENFESVSADVAAQTGCIGCHKFSDPGEMTYGVKTNDSMDC